MTKVVIIGAGVVGLTTAYRLLQSGFDVSIIAQYLPSDQTLDYTSTKAGAFYIPLTPRTASARDKELDFASYDNFVRFHDTRPDSGILLTKARVLVHESEASEADDYIQNGGPWWKDRVQGFRELPKSEFPTDKIVYGFEYDSFVATPTHYLHFLLMECIKLGLKYRRFTVSKVEDAINCFLTPDGGFTKGDVVINCSGIGAFKLAPDDKNMVYIKGQTVLVENCVPFLTTVDLKDPDHPEEMVYVIPRKEGGSLLNGIYAHNDNSTHLDENLTQRIMQRALTYAPELIDTSIMSNKPYLKVVSYNIGVRPGRKGSPRVEFEQLPNGVKCVHNYGNGSSGYIQSFGAAEKVLEILTKEIKLGAKL